MTALYPPTIFQRQKAATPRAAGEEVQDRLQVESLRKTIFLVLGLLRFSWAVAEKPLFSEIRLSTTHRENISLRARRSCIREAE